MSRIDPHRLQRASIFVALLLLGAVIGWQSIQMGAGQAAVRARNGPAAAVVRPENGWGLALLAEREFDQGQTADALEASRAAIRRTPYAVVAVRTLAKAEGKLHGPTVGEPAWQAASLLGWRDKQVQVWAAFRALSNGQAEIFAMRADALLRTGDPDELMTRFIRQAVVQPEIRRAFLTRLATNPPWRTRFFQAEAPPRGRALQGVVAVLNDLRAGQTPPDRQELRDAIIGLIDARRFEQAAALDRRYIRRVPDPGSLLDDGGFDLEHSDYEYRATPFDWTIDPRGAAVEEAGGQRYIVILPAVSPDPPLRRFVALPPANYRLEFSISGEPDGGQAPQLVVSCAASGAAIGKSADAPLAGGQRQMRALDFNVPAGCGLVLLKFRRTQPGASVALIDDIRLTQI